MKRFGLGELSHISVSCPIKLLPGLYPLEKLAIAPLKLLEREPKQHLCLKAGHFLYSTPLMLT